MDSNPPISVEQVRAEVADYRRLKAEGKPIPVGFLLDEFAQTITRLVERVEALEYNQSARVEVVGAVSESEQLARLRAQLATQRAEIEKFSVKFEHEGKTYDLLEWQAFLQKECGIAKLHLAQKRAEIAAKLRGLLAEATEKHRAAAEDAAPYMRGWEHYWKGQIDATNAVASALGVSLDEPK